MDHQQMTSDSCKGKSVNCRLPTLGQEGGKRSALPQVIMTFDSKFALRIQSEAIKPAGALRLPLPDRL